MLLALLLLAGIADWVPIHWPSAEPKSLGLLDGSGFNCVLIESADLNAGFIQAAAKRGIGLAAVVRPGAKEIEETRRAEQLHVDAIVLEGDFRGGRPSGLKTPVIELPDRQQVRLESPDAVIGSWQGLWPGIAIESSGRVVAGPSSNPWINTNTGFVRFLRAATDRAVWLGMRTPEKTAIPPERYGLAIADAEAAGGRWTVTLDKDLQTRLLAGEPRALSDWKRITSYVNFFEAHSEWRDFHPFSKLGLIEDTNSGGLLSANLLDLMCAQHVAVKALSPGHLTPANLRGVGTLINIVPPEHLSASDKRALTGFVEGGGSLVSPPPGWRFGADAPGSVSLNKQQLARNQDIWEMVADRTARQNFGAKTYNTAGILFNVLASPDQKRMLIHLVNYTGFAADAITVHASGTWKRARVYQPDAAVHELSVYAVEDGTAVEIDTLGVAATILLE